MTDVCSYNRPRSAAEILHSLVEVPACPFRLRGNASTFRFHWACARGYHSGHGQCRSREGLPKLESQGKCAFLRISRMEKES